MLIYVNIVRQINNVSLLNKVNKLNFFSKVNRYRQTVGVRAVIFQTLQFLNTFLI